MTKNCLGPGSAPLNKFSKCIYISIYLQTILISIYLQTILISIYSQTIFGK